MPAAPPSRTPPAHLTGWQGRLGATLGRLGGYNLPERACRKCGCEAGRGSGPPSSRRPGRPPAARFLRASGLGTPPSGREAGISPQMPSPPCTVLATCKRDTKKSHWSQGPPSVLHTQLDRGGQPQPHCLTRHDGRPSSAAVVVVFQARRPLADLTDCKDPFSLRSLIFF